MKQHYLPTLVALFARPNPATEMILNLDRVAKRLFPEMPSRLFPPMPASLAAIANFKKVI